MRTSLGESPFAVFPAAHPDVGDIAISDEGDEVTVALGNFTHCHFANYDQGIDDAARVRRIGESQVEFLEDLFADRIEMYGSHRGGGGSRRISAEPRGVLSKALFGRKTYVWSGPTSNDG